MTAQAQKQQQKRERMLKAPVKGLICRLAVPTIISMLVTTFYNMADTFFVGKLDNTSATGAVGVVFSLMAIIQAVGFFFGHGSGNYISKKLGANDSESANKMASVAFFTSFSINPSARSLFPVSIRYVLMLFLPFGSSSKTEISRSP